MNLNTFNIQVWNKEETQRSNIFNFGVIRDSVSILGRLNGQLEAISLWMNAGDAKRFVSLLFKEKKAALQQGLYQNREAKLRNIWLAINKLNLIMESQNGAVVGYYGIRFVLPTGKAENNSSTGFTAACAAFFYPILFWACRPSLLLVFA